MMNKYVGVTLGCGCHFGLGLFSLFQIRDSRIYRTREKRMSCKIFVVANRHMERAMRWYYFLDENLSFPFTATELLNGAISPLKKGEEMKIVAMARANDCLAEMFALIDLGGRRVGVPLAQ